MNKKFEAAVPATREEIEEARRRGVRAEDSMPAAAPMEKDMGKAATMPTQDEIETARRNSSGEQGPDAAK